MKLPKVKSSIFLSYKSPREPSLFPSPNKADQDDTENDSDGRTSEEAHMSPIDTETNSDDSSFGENDSFGVCDLSPLSETIGNIEQGKKEHDAMRENYRLPLQLESKPFSGDGFGFDFDSYRHMQISKYC